MLINPVLVFFQPGKQWQTLANIEDKYLRLFIPYLLIMAAVPCLSWIYGTTEVGWQIGDGDITRLTMSSATTIAIAMYVATLIAVSTIGYAVHWMAETYGSKSTVMKGVALVSVTATPFFILGLSGLYPLFWVDLMLSIVGVCWSTYLLYTSIPVVMDIPKDRGFMFASALLAVSLVIFLVMLGATAVLWDMGILPVFAD